MKNHSFLLLMAFVSSGLFISGCSNLEITKRRYMPGYHIELGNKKQEARPAAETAAAPKATEETMTAMETPAAQITIPTSYSPAAPPMEGELTASTSKGIAPSTKPGKPARSLAALTDELVLKPFRELKQEKADSELRRAVFPEEGDEKYGWSVVGIIALGLSMIALVALLIGLATLVSGGAFWFIPLILGFVFGLTGMILGIIGVRQTKNGGKRGRGFALAGMILGILTFALSLVALVIGAILTFIDNGGFFDNQ